MMGLQMDDGNAGGGSDRCGSSSSGVDEDNGCVYYNGEAGGSGSGAHGRGFCGGGDNESRLVVTAV